MSHFVKCVGCNQSEKAFTIGKVYEVKDNTITSDDGFVYNRSGRIKDIIKWLGEWYEFEPVEQRKIVITTDGTKVTTATLYADKKVVKTATAKCAPEDTFDFMVGAKLAVERLGTPIEKTPEKPKYYNGKVVCVKSPYRWWTVGKVYEVKDGIITADDGDKYPKFNERYTSVDEVRHAGCIDGKKTNPRNEFIPLVED